ncbi:MAG TPA: hypothetical protein VLT84_02855, partial [Acidobacteriota bacterium]|nr:hypothetical protein [Acidobacteriota bacterium]
LKHIRRQTKILVAFGDCAVTGNITAMRNPLPSSVRGAQAPSGIYFAKVSARGDNGSEVTGDVVKMVMAK